MEIRTVRHGEQTYILADDVAYAIASEASDVNKDYTTQEMRAVLNAIAESFRKIAMEH